MDGIGEMGMAALTTIACGSDHPLADGAGSLQRHQRSTADVALARRHGESPNGRGSARLIGVACLLILLAFGGWLESVWAIPPCRRADWVHWSDLDGDGRDTRQEVLARDARPSSVRWSEDGRRVAGGVWLDPYTGAVLEDPAQLDIDHLLAVCEAHRAGGWRWTKEQKRQFANDPLNLWAVSLGANRAKGDKGPEAWVPERPEIRCRWLERRALVRQVYGLPTPAAERAAVRGLAAAACR